MLSRAHRFTANARAQLADARLQGNLAKTRGKFVDKRAQAIATLDDFAALRAAAARLRDRALDDLPLWLERFEAQAQARGAQVLWASDAAQASRLVVEIAQRHGVRKAVKAKSMLSEEAGLNQALSAAGITPVETDLGEYILQINDNEPPSHIVAPVVHKSLDEIADLFARVHGTPRKTDIPALTREAREVLRQHFLSADMGISGANFLIAETGSALIVTNEGNGRMSTTLPRLHVVLAGIEKVIPSLDDAALLLRLLPRSATGQAITNYVSLLTGVRAAGESDGPDHLYFVLVDNGRSAVAGSEFHAMLRCIRCGACMNHCPVYQSVGGHAYGWVYPGPMGSILTPLYIGLEKAPELPQAATLCGQCSAVCPVEIPLPDLLRRLRAQQWQRGLRPRGERVLIGLWGWLAQHPWAYRWALALTRRGLQLLAGGRPSIRFLPFAHAWTRTRDFPAPQGPGFVAQQARSTRQRTP